MIEMYAKTVLICRLIQSFFTRGETLTVSAIRVLLAGSIVGWKVDGEVDDFNSCRDAMSLEDLEQGHEPLAKKYKPSSGGKTPICFCDFNIHCVSKSFFKALHTHSVL
jgi:hypothetical protein